MIAKLVIITLLLPETKVKLSFKMKLVLILRNWVFLFTSTSPKELKFTQKMEVCLALFLKLQITEQLNLAILTDRAKAI